MDQPKLSTVGSKKAKTVQPSTLAAPVEASKLVSPSSLQAKTAVAMEEEEIATDTKLGSLAMPADYVPPQIKIQARDLPVSLAGATQRPTLQTGLFVKKIGALPKKGRVKKKKGKGKGKGKGKKKSSKKGQPKTMTMDTSVTAGEREQLGDDGKYPRKMGKGGLSPAMRRAIFIGIVVAIIIAIIIGVVVGTRRSEPAIKPTTRAKTTA